MTVDLKILSFLIVCYNTTMKFYENLPQQERRAMILKSVALSASLEGMMEPARKFLKEANLIELEGNGASDQSIKGSKKAINFS